MKDKKVTKRKIKSSLLFIWAGAFTDIFAFTILNPFLPRFYLDLGAPLGQIGLLLAVNSFIGFFSGILWGKLSDRFGRRPILLICRLGALAGYIILAFSTNIPMILISRIVDGIFSRSILVSLTAVGDLVSPEDRSLEMSKVGIPWIAGGLIGPALGGLLSEYGLMGIGLACAGLTLFTLLNTLITFNETHPVFNRPETDKNSPKEFNPPSGAFALLKQHNPRVLLLVNLFSFLSHLIFVTTSTLYLTRRFELNVGEIGRLLTLVGAVNLFVRLVIFPRVLTSYGDRKTYRIGLISFLLAYSGLFFTTRLWGFVIVSALVSFGTICSVDVMHGIMSRYVRRDEQGQMMGLNAMVESISLVLGPIIGSGLLSLRYSGFYSLSAIATSLTALFFSTIPLKDINTSGKSNQKSLPDVDLNISNGPHQG